MARRATEAALDRHGPAKKDAHNMLVMFVLPVIIIVALVASLPIWPHSKKWGFYPISGVSLIILIILFLFWTGRLSPR
jgi:bacteriorhodopsin